MIDRVLVPMDDSEMAQKALEYALKAYDGAEITVMHVVGKPTPMMGEIVGLALEDDLQGAAEQRAEEIFDNAHNIAEKYDTEITTTVAIGHPARNIVEKSAEFDTVVIGSHSGSLADQLYVGNIAKKVFRSAPIPVVVIR